MLNSEKILLTMMCGFFLTALLTGVWKYRHMLGNADHRAPFYVNVAHSAALHYSFACPVLWVLLKLSVWPEAVNLAAVVVLLAFFALAIATYIRLGAENRTDNQFRERNFQTTVGMWLLIAGEIGGFLVLASGALQAVWAGA